MTAMLSLVSMTLLTAAQPTPAGPLLPGDPSTVPFADVLDAAGATGVVVPDAARPATPTPSATLTDPAGPNATAEVSTAAAPDDAGSDDTDADDATVDRPGSAPITFPAATLPSVLAVPLGLVPVAVPPSVVPHPVVTAGGDAPDDTTAAVAAPVVSTVTVAQAPAGATTPAARVPFTQLGGTAANPAASVPPSAASTVVTPATSAPTVDAAPTPDVAAPDRQPAPDATMIVPALSALPALPVTPQPVAASAPVTPAPPQPVLPPELPQPALAAALGRVRRGPDGVHQLEVALHPADLGSVRVRVTISHGTLDVTVACADPAAREAVSAALPALHRDLAGLGRVEVTSDRPPPDSSTGSQRERGSPDTPDQPPRHPRRQDPAPDDDFDRWM